METYREVMIVTSSPLLGGAMQKLVESDRMFKVAATVCTREELTDCPMTGLDAVVVLGISAPPPLGPEFLTTCESLCRMEPEVPVVAVVPEECLCQHFMYRLTEVGVVGCLDWSCHDQELLACLHDVCVGRTHHGKMSTRLLNEYNSRKTLKGECGATRKLSPREAEVVELAITSMTLDQIADRLGIARGTVQTHCKRIYQKLGVHDRVELMRWWVTNGRDSSLPS
jgi:DNA-binding NarL/FixJ family response regulator